MRRLRTWIGGLAAVSLAVSVGTALAQNQQQSPPQSQSAEKDKTKDNATDKAKSKIVTAKKQGGADVVPQRPEQTPEQPQAAPEAPPAAPSTTQQAAPNDGPAPPPQNAGPAADQVGSGQIAAQPNSDLGKVISESSATTGIEIQRRNTVIADPRVRAYHIGQLATWGDGGYFFPARQDLDTAISKFDPAQIQNLTVIKGPYATRYGPGFAFLDIITFDTPRSSNCCNGEFHTRTTFGYQTNGERRDGTQVVEYGAKDWGFRASYSLLAGNDYYNGDHVLVPSSYNSQNWNFAIGYDISPTSSIELKGIRLFQHDVELAGLYFDIRDLNTEAYSVRYKSKESPYYDLFTADFWWNYTVAGGDTLQQYKQDFLSRFLPGRNGFNLATSPVPIPGVPSFFDPTAVNPGPGFLPLLQDRSTSEFSERTLGYRLASMYGKKDNLNFTIGTDFTYLGQSQTETIAIVDPNNLIATDGSGLATQNLGLPESNLYNPGLFLESSIPINERLSARAGARVDYERTTTGNRLITGNIDIFGGTQFPGPPINRTTVDPRVFSSDPTSTDDNREFGLFAGFLTSEYKFDDALTGLIGFGYAERAPTLTELYATGPFVGILQPGFDRLIGDPQLRKEQNTQFDIGLRGDYGWFKGSVNGFYAWIHNYITYDRNKFGDGITQVVFTNTDRATLAGGEIYGQVEATSWLTPFTALSYVEGRDLSARDNKRAATLVSSRRTNDETEPLPGIPPLEMRSGFRIHESVPLNKSPKWSAEMSVRTVWTQDNAALSLGEFPTPGFTVWDLRTYWLATDHLTFATGVENIGDKNYREHIDPRAGDLFWRQGVNFYFTTQVKY